MCILILFSLLSCMKQPYVLYILYYIIISSTFVSLVLSSSRICDADLTFCVPFNLCGFLPF